jgi:hypothetical protein
MAIPLVASPAPPQIGPVERITGASSNFAGSVGNWIVDPSGSGITLSYTGTPGINGNGSAYCVQSSRGVGLKLPLSGTFKAGRQYQLLVLFRANAAALAAGTYVVATVEFGDWAALDHSSAHNNQGLYYAEATAGVVYESQPYAWIPAVVAWTPSADRSGPNVYVRARMAGGTGGPIPFWIGQARLIEVAEGSGVGLMTPYRYGMLDGSYGGGTMLLPVGDWESSYEPRSPIGQKWRMRPGNIGFLGQQNSLGDNDEVAFYMDGLYLYASQADTGRRQARLHWSGYDLEVGADYGGLVIGERSASEIEIQPDGTNDIILVDGDLDADTTHFWFTEDATGANKSWLGLLHMLKAGTANPSAGGGVASAVGSLYMRDNAGSGELWLKTGAAATAWTQITVP